MITNPHLLPKVRSDGLRREIANMQCELRIASFVGRSCSPGTVVPVHMDGLAPSLGKGTGTKVSDLNMVAGCQTCHDILARVDPVWQVILERYPAAAQKQIHLSHQATLARWLGAGRLIVPDGEII